MGFLMNRGDIVICVLKGDYGKPRPAVVIQSDLFNLTHTSITICPITSYLIDAPLFRITLIPSEFNNLLSPSQIMVDKITSIKEVSKLNKALKLWLSLK